jgi:hypothetical protein
MPGNNKQGTVVKGANANWSTTFQKGTSNLSSLQASFGTSPLYDDQGYSFQKMIEVANEQLAPKSANQPGDLSYFPKGVDLTFSGRGMEHGPPSYNDVDTQVPGLIKSAISSPFTPNTASPGATTDGSVNMSPPEKAPAADLVVPNFAAKAANIVNPAKTSGQLSTVKLGDKLSLGSSGASSRGT